MRDFLFFLLALYTAGFVSAQVGVIPRHPNVTENKSTAQKIDSAKRVSPGRAENRKPRSERKAVGS